MINNQDLGHVHGMCNPFNALNGEIADAVIAAGIGTGAIRKLNSMGIKVYRQPMTPFEKILIYLGVIH